MKEMTASDRFRAVIRREPMDRLPVMEWAPWWHLTVNRWREEGVPEASLHQHTLQRYFGLDGCLQFYVSQRTAQTPQPKYSGGPLAETEAEYLEVRKTLFPDPGAYFTRENLAPWRKIQEAGDTVLFFTMEGFFWHPRTIFGIEPHLYSFYDEPELYHMMCRDMADWQKKAIEALGNSGFRFDFMTFAEDMSYNNGPIISHDSFTEFLTPYYNEICPLLHQLEIPIIIDSDGDITKAVDWYREVGADGMLPLERQAGVDVSLYLDKHPDMTFIGHFDKMCMKFGEEAMTAEFERLLPSMKRGGFIPSVDHQTPPDVSVENYRIYVSLLKRYAAEAVR